MFVGVVALVGGSAYWLNDTSYARLFSDLDPEAASQVVSRLKAQKIGYQLDEGGRGIRVPAEKVDELRLDFSSQGLPSSGRIGFEIFDRTSFGGEFLEQINYRRALEGEIARTIASLSEIANARVHIVMPRDTIFSSGNQRAKASVVLKLRANRPLAPTTIHAITSLVAASVEGLRPESVVLVDNSGRPLSRPDDGSDEPLAAVELERQQRLEKDLAARVVSLLEPVVGKDRVRVNVAARLARETEENTEERWDPTTVVRSRQLSGDGRGGVLNEGRVAGSRANLPTPQPTPAPGAGATASNPVPPPAAVGASPPPSFAGRGSETVNYEVSKLVRHTIRPSGGISRLTVAVIVDQEQVVTTGRNGAVTRTAKPRDPAQIEKIQALVAAAVGLDMERGDHLTVESIPFDAPVVEDVPAPTFWQRYGIQVLDGARTGAVVLLGVMAFFVVLRPIVRRVMASVPAHMPAAVVLPQQLPRTVQELEGDIEAQLEAASSTREVSKGRVLVKRLGAMAEKEPENAAKMLRAWLMEEPRS